MRHSEIGRDAANFSAAIVAKEYEERRIDANRRDNQTVRRPRLGKRHIRPTAFPEPLTIASAGSVDMPCSKRPRCLLKAEICSRRRHDARTFSEHTQLQTKKMADFCAAA
jgi:hypothetical protein